MNCDQFVNTLDELTARISNNECAPRLSTENMAGDELKLAQAINRLLHATCRQTELSTSSKNRKESILATLGNSYNVIGCVDLKANRHEIVLLQDRSDQSISSLLAHSPCYDDAMDAYIKYCVNPNDTEYLRKRTTLEVILEKLKTKKLYSVRYTLKENPDELVNMEVSYGFSSDGKLIVGFHCIDDIVQKETAYKDETIKNIETTLSSANVGIWSIELIDGYAPKLYADRTMRRLIEVSDNLTPEETYQQWTSNIDSDYIQECVDFLSLISESKHSEITYPWISSGGRKIWIRCGGVRDDSFSEEGIRLTGYHIDITDSVLQKKEQELKLKKALIEAQRANRVKTDFLSHMSHDIRTPINGILGMISIMEKNSQNIEKCADSIGKIRTLTGHLLSLLNDVLDISKLESGSVRFTEEDFDIEEVLINCRDIFTSQAEEAKVTLEIKKVEATHKILTGSSRHLRQILVNLISNGIKFNKIGGRIEVSAKELSTGNSQNKTTIFQFIVKDNGIGMSQEFLPDIYEPFVQEKNSSARTKYEGAGLGMAITKKLVCQFGGKINVQSELGKGTVVTVEIPLKISEKALKEENAELKNQDKINVEGMKVLLVEDNEMNREIAKYLLEDAGITVECAFDGKEAFDVFESSPVGKFDCILMDIMMPVMNGLEATKLIRESKHSDSKSVPIFALSANVFEEDVAQSKAAGMNEHLTKPLNTERLFKVMTEYRKKNS